MPPFNLFWIGVAVGAVLLIAPQLLLRSTNGYPIFGGDDDSAIMRMGRVSGFILMVIFGALLLASSKGR